MAKHRPPSVEFKRQVSQEYLTGETLHGLSKRHDISRNLIRIWIDKYQAGTLDDAVTAADLLQYSFRSGPRPRSETISAIIGPTASAS